MFEALPALLKQADPLLLLILGGLLLAFGRKLYWAFVGLVGFALGLHFATQALGSPTAPTGWLLALVVASMAALAAVFFQKIAIGVVGFLAGALLVLVLAEPYLTGLWLALAAVVGGLLASALTKALFKISLVVLSAALGAALVAQAQGWTGPRGQLLWLGLALAGTLFQLLLGRKRKSKDSD